MSTNKEIARNLSKYKLYYGWYMKLSIFHGTTKQQKKINMK